MAFQRPLHRAVAALQSQHLTSHTGGGDMLGATTNDTSFGSFAAAADGTYELQAPSGSRNASQATRYFSAGVGDSLRLMNNVRSYQLAPDSSFSGVSCPADSSSDWIRLQSSAANNDGLAFSSSHQGCNLSRSRGAQHEEQNQMVPHYASPQAHEHTGQELPHDFQYSEREYSHFDPRDMLQEPPSLPRSPELFVANSSSSVPVTQPCISPNQPHALSCNQPGPTVHSRHASQDSNPTVIISPSGDKDDPVPENSMINGPNYAQEGFLRTSNFFTYDPMDQTVRANIIGGAGFNLPVDLQFDLQSLPNLEASITSSETASSTTTFPSRMGRGRGKSKCLQVASISHRRRLSDSYSTLFGSLGSQSLDRTLSTGSSVRRNSSGQATLLPKPGPHTSGATDGSGASINGKPIPKKPRGKRTGPLRDGRRELATKRRNERTVCIGCKMAKVMCDGREDGRDCSRCASHSNAPKPFVCAPASFFELVQQGSTVLLALHTIYPVSGGFRQPLGLPSEIHIRYLLDSINELRKYNDVIRVYAGNQMLYELDLHACWVNINSTCSPVRHPFQQLINGLKVQRQDGWKTCIRDGRNQPLNKENLCDTLLALDDMAPWVTYALMPKPNYPHGNPNDEAEMVLGPDNEIHRQVIIVAAQLSRIIGRKLELQFYDHLKKALANPSICSKLVLDVGHTLMSLRRRLFRWTQHWAGVSFPTTSENETHGDEDGGNGSSILSNPAARIKSLCQVLYVYFCYMRRRLSPDDQESIRTTFVWYPESGQTVEESFPQYESIDGFEEWLQFKEQPMADMDMDSDAM